MISSPRLFVWLIGLCGCSLQVKDTPPKQGTEGAPSPGVPPAQGPTPGESPKAGEGPTTGGGTSGGVTPPMGVPPPQGCPPGVDAPKALAGGPGVVVAQKLTQGDSVFTTGYVQVTAQNQDAFVAKVTGSTLQWCGAYGRTPADERGVALGWVAGRLFAAFSVDGDSTSETKFRPSPTPWQSRYGAGGGPKGAYIVQIDPQTGGQVAGTWFTPRNQPSSGSVDWSRAAFRNDGPPQSISVTALEESPSGHLQVKALVWGFGPGCTVYAGDGRRTYVGQLSLDLTQLFPGPTCPPPP